MRVVFLAALAATTAAAPAEAGIGVAVAAPVVEGKLGEENAERLEAALREGIARDGLRVAAAPGEYGNPCADSTCASELAGAAEVTHVVTWRIAVRGRDFEIEMSLRDANGELVGTSQRACVICGLQEVAATVADQAAALRSKLDVTSDAPRLRVSSTPSGAEVRIDGTLVGVTPFDDEVELGTHQVEVSKRGFIARKRRVTSVESVDESITFELQPLPAVRNRPLRIGGAVATSLGTALLITGATFLSLHRRPVRSQCSGDDVDADGDCRLRFNGLPTGIPLVITGAAGLATGIALLVIDRRRNDSGPRAQLKPGGFAVQF